MENALLDPVEIQTLESYKKKLQEAKDEGDKDAEGHAYHDIGMFYYEHEDYEKAIKYHEQHLRIAKRRGKEDQERCAYNNLTDCYDKRRDYKKCIEYDEILARIAKNAGEKEEEARLHRHLGFSCYNLEEYEQAIKYLQHALTVSKEVENRDEERRACKNLLACYDKLEDYNESIKYGEQLIQMAEKEYDEDEQGVQYGNLGFYYFKLDEFKTAIDCHLECLRIAKERQNFDEERRAISNLMGCYEELDDYKQTIKYARQLVVIAKEKGDSHEEERLYGDLEIYYVNLTICNGRETSLAIVKETADIREQRLVSKVLKLLKENDENQILPFEIAARGPQAKVAYVKALRIGKVKVHRARIMFIGQDRAGKTSLKKSLLGLPFDRNEQSTVGIEVDPSLFEIDVDQVKNWQLTENKGFTSQFAKEVAKIAASELQKDNGKPKVNLKTQEEQEKRRSNQVPIVEQSKRTSNNSMPSVNMKKPAKTKKDNDHRTDIRRRETPISTATCAINHTRKTDFVNHQVHEIDPNSPPKEFTEYLVQYLKDLNLQSDSSSTEPVVDLDLWDFAGQHLYYASHPVFFSHRAIYLLVCNLSKELDGEAEPCFRQGLVEKRLGNPNGETNLENMLSWLVSVDAISPTKYGKKEEKVSYVRPPVLLVGTHADQPAQDIDKMKLQIQKELLGKVYGRHVIAQFFSIDNTQSSSDTSVRKLRTEILKVLNTEPYFGEEIPVRWFEFEKVVQALTAKNKVCLNIEALQDIVKKVCFVEGKTELAVMLNFYHDIGMIVKHGNTVVLKAQWLIDLFKRLITIPRYEDLGRDCKNVTEWKVLEETGILHMDLVRLVFSDFIKKDSVTEKDILGMMERFGLIAKFETSADVKYFVPAQLKTSLKHLYEMKPEPFHPCPLYIDFLNGFVPHGIYYQLVSRCIRWCSEYGCQEQPSLFNCGARFYISKQDVYQLILLCQKRFIKVVLTHRKPSKEEYLAEQSQVASDVLSFLNSALEGLSKQIPWQGNLRYELRVACPFCPLLKIKCHEHGNVSCAHENCFCLLKMVPEEKLICPRSVCNEIPSVSGLGKWFFWGRLKENAFNEGLRVSDNQGSGNCMFYALSEQLESAQGIRIHQQELRSTLVQFLKKNPYLPDGTHLFNFVTGHQSWNEYLSKMEQDGAWGDHLILRAAGNCYKSCIRVVSNLPQNNVTITPDCPVDGRNPLTLGHIHEVHYVSLQPIQGTSSSQKEACAEILKENQLPRPGISKKREFSGESVSPQKVGNAKRLKEDELTSSVKQGTPTEEELEEIASEIADKWKILGRRLGVNDPKLKDIEQAHTSLCERAYQMLLHWKQKESANATYQVLSCALRHKFVQRTDLAEKFCLTDGNFFL